MRRGLNDDGEGRVKRVTMEREQKGFLAVQTINTNQLMGTGSLAGSLCIVIHTEKQEVSHVKLFVIHKKTSVEPPPTPVCKKRPPKTASHCPNSRQ